MNVNSSKHVIFIARRSSCVLMIYISDINNFFMILISHRLGKCSDVKERELKFVLLYDCTPKFMSDFFYCYDESSVRFWLQYLFYLFNIRLISIGYSRECVEWINNNNNNDISFKLVMHGMFANEERYQEDMIHQRGRPFQFSYCLKL